MSDTLSILKASMQADAAALRVVAQNLAGAEVPAYRRQIAVAAGVGFEQLISGAEQLAATPLTPEVALTPQTELAIDQRSGTLKATGRPFDIAIEGAAFLALQTASGIALTRRGDLHVAPDGTLTAASGDPVLGEQGPIHVGTATPTIDPDGSVRISGDVVDRLQLRSVSALIDLEDLGNGLYADRSGASSIDEHSTLRQGFLETSNVTPVGEMVQLMETMRRFEATQRFVRGYDQMLEKAISELGKAS